MERRKRQPNRNWARLYTDVKSDRYWRVLFTNAKKHVDVPITIDRKLMAQCQRGIPFECRNAIGSMRYAEAHPEAFPHPVLHAYFLKRSAYFVTRVAGVPTHAVRYFYDDGDRTDKFDKGERQILGKTLVLHLRPAKKRGGGEPAGARDKRRREGEPQLPISRGALRRAINAGFELPQRARKKKAG